MKKKIPDRENSLRKLNDRNELYKLPVIESHGDAKYSIGNVVNILITMYGIIWVLDLLKKTSPLLFKKLCLPKQLCGRQNNNPPKMSLP